MIPITKTKLPPLDRYNFYLKKAWDNGQVTNDGILVKELEKSLCSYLGVKYLSLVSSGTVGIMLALKAIQQNKNYKQNEVNTTPFTYVATTSAILWSGLSPKIVDINDNNFNINVDLVKKNINSKTCAILPVHVYGNPADVCTLQEISNNYNVDVAYDASHCFGMKWKDTNNSIFNHGKFSVCSLHATKVLGTGEGGFIVSKDLESKQLIDSLRAFGITKDKGLFYEGGLNAKMSEFNAAFGLASLEIYEDNIKKRQRIYRVYKECLPSGFNLIDIEQKGLTHNYAYAPVLLAEYLPTDIISYLNDNNVTARRYFYPSLDKFYQWPYGQSDYPVSNNAAERIICLPMFPELTIEEVEKICNILKKF